ncbi:MAG: HypC/HybG/HupF family hydrogenase formation chaperone [candidate division KSB1 bacterium]|nr:HypC/HybG/HupF family hydrogenase formation chaperone [candidate division KSB1 bacterium]
MCLAIPGKILSIEGSDPVTRKGRVSFDGVVREVHLGYVPDAKPGDYVNVHVGFAIGVLDEQEAKEIYGILDEIESITQQRKRQ